MQNRNVGPQDPGAERPLADLFADLARETGALMRQEMQLAKLELSHKAKQAGRGAGYGLVLAGVAGLKRIDPLPQQTIETLKEDSTWTKQHLVP
jgi:hypothetical protein